MSIISKIAEALLKTEIEVRILTRSAPFRYKVYLIPKRNSKSKRRIAQPAREIKALQRWLINNFLNMFPVHEAASAYCRGKNIYDNANAHANNAFLLKLDFKDFFPSIKASDLHSIMDKNKVNMPEEDKDAICNMLFWKSRYTRELELSIGAPSSPILSNIILYDFDCKVSSLCEKKCVAYSRYADDLIFSTNEPQVLHAIHLAIEKLCKEIDSPNVVLNEGKTHYTSKKHRRRVTGLIITNEKKISLGRNRKREIRATLHHCISGRLTPSEKVKLAGLLSFAHSIEPDFVRKLFEKHDIKSIKSLLKDQ